MEGLEHEVKLVAVLLYSKQEHSFIGIAPAGGLSNDDETSKGRVAQISILAIQ